MDIVRTTVRLYPNPTIRATTANIVLAAVVAGATVGGCGTTDSDAGTQRGGPAAAELDGTTEPDGATTTRSPGSWVPPRPEREDDLPPVEGPVTSSPAGPVTAEEAATGWVRSALTIDRGQGYSAVARRTATWCSPGSDAAGDPDAVRGASPVTVTVEGAAVRVVADLAGEATVTVTAAVTQAPQLRHYRVLVVAVEDDRWLVESADPL